MLLLLRELDIVFCTELETVKYAFDNTPPGSPLRNLMAEEVVRHCRDTAWSGNGDLAMFDGVAGFSTSLMDAVTTLDEIDEDWESDVDPWGDYRKRPKRWEAFVVDEGPKKHWIYGDW